MGYVALDLLFTFVEGLFIFLVCFSLFGIGFRENLAKALILNLIISCLMYIVYTYSFLIPIAPFITLVLFVVGIWLVFKIRLLESYYVATVTLMTVMCVQGFIFIFADLLFHLSMLEIQTDKLLVRSVQSIEIAILLIIALVIKQSSKKIKGFKFSSYDNKVEFTRMNNILLLLMSIVGTLMTLFYNSEPMSVTIIFITTLLFVLLYLGVNKGNK